MVGERQSQEGAASEFRKKEEQKQDLDYLLRPNAEISESDRLGLEGKLQEMSGSEQGARLIQLRRKFDSAAELKIDDVLEPVKYEIAPGRASDEPKYAISYKGYIPVDLVNARSFEPGDPSYDKYFNTNSLGWFEIMHNKGWTEDGEFDHEGNEVEVFLSEDGASIYCEFGEGDYDVSDKMKKAIEEALNALITE